MVADKDKRVGRVAVDVCKVLEITEIVWVALYVWGLK